MGMDHDSVAKVSRIKRRPQHPTLSLRNGTEPALAFTDISTEMWREYVFMQNGVKHVVRIDYPLYLNVSKTGHRVLDAQGVSHYIPKGWIHLLWEVSEGCPHFVK